jgi:hypothetical protein
MLIENLWFATPTHKTLRIIFDSAIQAQIIKNPLNQLRHQKNESFSAICRLTKKQLGQSTHPSLTSGRPTLFAPAKSESQPMLQTGNCSFDVAGLARSAKALTIQARKCVKVRKSDYPLARTNFWTSRQ